MQTNVSSAKIMNRITRNKVTT